MREKECPWNGGTCAGAAHGGHFKVLQWARAEGCHWDRITCMAAARGGHFKVLQWLLENGCPYEEQEIRKCVVDPKFWKWFRNHKTTFPMLEEDEGGDY